MTTEILTYALLAALAIVLLAASWTDLKRREIDHWVPITLLIGAPIYWLASGVEPWPGMALQLGIALGIFLFCTMMFAFNAMGGGDVKLLSTLSLWFPALVVVKLWIVMGFAGLVLTIFTVFYYRRKRLLSFASGHTSGGKEHIQVPYGIAISFAGLWIVTEQYLNHFM